MQFKRQQREAAAKYWNATSWFYQNLGTPARQIVEHAYGITTCTAKERAQSQEYLTLALSLFARKIGADKSHVVHALLTGSVDSLIDALGRKAHVRHVSSITLADDWQEAFRDVANP
jgi:hypothetical protein